MRISEITRRDIQDALRLETIVWSGRLDEVDFLARIYDLQAMPSHDRRFKNAAGDIWQHRLNNYDWQDDYWVFNDDRFDLARGDDDILLRFLCETIHPVVRSDPKEAERLRQLYNQFLEIDGYEIVEKTKLSGRSIYAARDIGTFAAPGVKAAREVLASADPGYIAQQITRMEAAVQNDPALAIGTAKELVETCCRTILDERKVIHDRDIDLLRLVKLTAKTLALTPDDIPDQAKGAETIRRLLSNMAQIAQGIAELRNQYGTGHGKSAGRRGLGPRHAKLAVGAAASLSVFFVETHRARHLS